MPPQNMSAQSVRRLSLESGTVWSLLATIVLAGLIMIPAAVVPFLPTKAFVLAIGTIITLALFIVSRLSRGNVVLPPLMLVGALWLPALAYALSTAFSPASASVSLFGFAFNADSLVFMVVAALLGTLTALSLRRPEHYRTFFCVTGYGFAVLLALQVAIVVVGQFSSTLINPSFSLLGSYNDLGVLAGLGIVSILLTLRLTTPSPRTKTMLGVVAVAALMILVLSNASLVWILTALVSLALFVEAIMRNRVGGSETDLAGTTVLAEEESEHDAGGRPLAAPLAVLVISLFFLIGGTLSAAFAGALHVNVLDVRPSWQSTLAVGEHTYATSPVFGSGPGTFGNQWLKFRDAALNQTVFWNIDFLSGIGFVPTSLVTTGIVGAVAWILLIGLFLVTGIRALLLRSAEDAQVRYVSILSFVATCFLLAVAVFAVPGTVVLALTFVFAGLFISTLRYARGSGQWGIIFSKAPRLGFVIVFVLTLVLLASIAGAYAIVEQYAAQVSLARAAAALNNGNLDGALAETSRSITFAPSVTAYQAQAQVAQVRLTEIANSTTISQAEAQKQFQTVLTAGVSSALTATQLAPSDYQNWLALGNLYATVVPVGVSGAYDSAKAAYQKARDLNPTSPAIPYVMAQLEIAHNDTKAAEDFLKQSLTLKGDNPAVILLLSRIEVQRGNLHDALTAAEAALYFTPSDPTVLFQVGILRAASGNNDGAIQALSAAVLANPQFANARYFLAALDAKKHDYASAIAQLNEIAKLSDQNKEAVAPAIASLEAGKNPFPASLLSVTPPAVTGVQ